MPDINILVKGKIATAIDTSEYICGNSDYIAKFCFDAEWDAYETKTARFSYNGSKQQCMGTRRVRMGGK